MGAFLLIVTIVGYPEQVIARCATYKACSDAGAAEAAHYAREHHSAPSDFSYRVTGKL